MAIGGKQVDNHVFPYKLLSLQSVSNLEETFHLLYRYISTFTGFSSAFLRPKDNVLVVNHG